MRIIDLTDTAMEAQTRRTVRRKRADQRIVREATHGLRYGWTPETVLEYIHREVVASEQWVTA